jgi:hypothetical protein
MRLMRKFICNPYLPRTNRLHCIHRTLGNLILWQYSGDQTQRNVFISPFKERVVKCKFSTEKDGPPIHIGGDKVIESKRLFGHHLRAIFMGMEASRESDIRVKMKFMLEPGISHHRKIYHNYIWSQAFTLLHVPNRRPLHVVIN